MTSGRFPFTKSTLMIRRLTPGSTSLGALCVSPTPRMPGQWLPFMRTTAFDCGLWMLSKSGTMRTSLSCIGA